MLMNGKRYKYIKIRDSVYELEYDVFQEYVKHNSVILEGEECPECGGNGVCTGGFSGDVENMNGQLYALDIDHFKCLDCGLSWSE